MALINCPNCGNQMSDAAPACPHCGRPNDAAASGGAPETPASGGPQGGYGAPPPGGGYGPPPGGGYGPPPGSQHRGPVPEIPNYLVQAILVTLCCCLPLGIVSIVYASQVNSKKAAGDIAGAMESSANAKKWAWIGFGIGLVVNIILWAINGAAMLAGIAGSGGQY